MKNLWKSLLFSAVMLTAGVLASCEPTPEEGYQGTPPIEVAPASLSVDLAGGTTEEVTVTTPAEWTLQIDTEGVTASQESGKGDAVVTFTVPEATSMRTIKVTFTATGYVMNYPVPRRQRSLSFRATVTSLHRQVTSSIRSTAARQYRRIAAVTGLMLTSMRAGHHRVVTASARVA